VVIATGALVGTVLVGAYTLAWPPDPSGPAGAPESDPLFSPATPDLPEEPAPVPAKCPEAEPTVEPYGGKYAADAVFLERANRLVRLVPGAVGQIRTQLRLGSVSAPRIRVRFQDAGDQPQKYDANVMRTQEPGGVVQLLTVCSERLAVEGFDIPQLTLHEVAHCWQGHLLGNRMSTLPRWLKEGLADWVSLEGEEQGIRTFCSIDFKGTEDTQAILDRWHSEFLLKETENYADYAYAQLAVRYLRLLDPPGDGDAFLHRLFVGAKGLSWEEELFRSTGLRFPDFAARLRPWAESRVRQFLRNRDEFLAVNAYKEQGEWRAAAVAYEEFAARYPADVFAPRAMLETAMCRYRVGNFEESVRWLDVLSREWPQSGLDSSISMYRFLNACELHTSTQEERVKTLALGNAYLRDYSYLPYDRLRPIVKNITRLTR
jgi:hypothetical protein